MSPDPEAGRYGVCTGGLYINITLLGIYVVTVHKWPTSGCGDVPLLEPRPLYSTARASRQVIPLASLPSAHL